MTYVVVPNKAQSISIHLQFMLYHFEVAFGSPVSVILPFICPFLSWYISKCDTCALMSGFATPQKHREAQ